MKLGATLGSWVDFLMEMFRIQVVSSGCVFLFVFFNNNNSSLLKGPWNRLCELRQEHILNDFGGFHRLLHKARLPDPTHCVSTAVCGLCQNV